MTKIEKKAWPEYFQQILEGKKAFELRLNDFEINEGDTLVLREWDPATKDYTGRTLEKLVVGVQKLKVDDLTRFWPKEDIGAKGLQIISFR